MCFPGYFSPLLLIIPPCGAARTCVHFHSSRVTKRTQISWEFSPQLFLKDEFPPTPYTENFCLLVTVNGNPSCIHNCVFLKGAAGPRGQPVSIPSLAITPSPNPFHLA